MLTKVCRARINYLKLWCFLYYPLMVWSHIFTGCSQGGKVTFGNTSWPLKATLWKWPLNLSLLYRKQIKESRPLRMYSYFHVNVSEGHFVINHFDPFAKNQQWAIKGNVIRNRHKLKKVITNQITDDGLCHVIIADASKPEDDSQLWDMDHLYESLSLAGIPPGKSGGIWPNNRCP